ncbi:sugar ABC transporter substrate-binding protein [Pseudonocardia sp. TRM90224]|uniref:sugar ABC transporter substrate-binding protein n=1 Tax=Pseudonocardia sp. TRM90224 TaxID=2812678 RepID=UPI001E596B35|nr:sugar ABC transporter substrate-binding protein [Pseudonocardia sp. TRM90224]
MSRTGSRGVRRIGVAVLAAAALAVAGCSSGGGDQAPAGGGPVNGAGQTLRMWIMEGTNPDPKPYVDELSAAFEKQTGAKLEVEFLQWKTGHDKFTTAIAGGTTPDVAEVGTTWLSEFGTAGAFADLTQRVESAGLGDGLVKGLEEAGRIDGSLYGLPWYAGVRSVVYRKDVFAELGINPPTTWAEIVAAGQKIKAAKPDMLPFPIAGDNEFAVYPFVWAAGGDIATKNGDKWVAALDTPQARAGIQFYADLALKNGFSTPAAATWRETDLRDAFTKGQAAMIISGNWTPKALVEAAPELQGKIGAFSLPGENGGLAPAVLGGSLLSVFEGSKNQDLAWELVKLMGTGEFAEKWSTSSGYFPGTTALLQQAAQSTDPLVAPFAKQMVDAGRAVPVSPAFGQIQAKKTVATMMRSILTGEQTVEQATTAATAEMNTLFSSS